MKQADSTKSGKQIRSNIVSYILSQPIFFIIVIVLFTIAIVPLTRYASYKNDQVFESYKILVSNAEEIQSRLYRSHLQLESLIEVHNADEGHESYDAVIQLQEIQKSIAKIKSKKSFIEDNFEASNKNLFFEDIYRLERNLDKLIALTKQRLQNNSNETKDTELDQAYEYLFEQIILESQLIKANAHKVFTNNIDSFKHFRDLLNTIMMLLLLLTVILFFIFENSRSKSFTIQQSINTKLENEIAQRKITEESLAHINKLLKEEREIFLSGSVVVFKWRNEDGWPVEYVSPNVFELTGYSEHEFFESNITYADIISKEDLQRIKDEVEKYSQSGVKNSSHIPYRIIKKDGTEIWVAEYTTIIRNETDKITHYYGYVIDVTDRIKYELELAHRDELQNAIMQSTDDGILVVDNFGKVVTKNDTFFEIWQIPESYKNEEDDDKLIKYVLSQLVDPDAFIDKILKLYESKETSYDELEFKDGRIIERHSYPIFFKGKLSGRVWNFRDVTEKTQNLRSLQESEELYRDMFEKNTAIKLYIDPDGGHIVNANNAACEFYGYDIDKIKTLTINEINTLTPEEIKKEMEYARSHDKTSFSFKHRLANGEIRDVEVHSGPITHKDKTLLFSIVFDVTERKKAEQKLKENEEQFRFLLENILVGVAITTKDAKVLTVNKRFSEITGFQMDELKDDIADVYADSKDRLRFLEQINRFGHVENFETRFKKKNGDVIWVSMSTRIVTYKDVDAMLTVFIDITETKKLKDQHSRAEKLETAGKIAGQIAHDFNNLLAPLMAYPDFIRDELDEKHPALPYLDDIEKSAQLISDINQQLLTLGRRGHYNQEPLNINTIIHKIINDIKIDSESVKYKTDLSDDLMNILGGSSQLYRVFANLIHNAKDAIGDSGLISIRTENFYIDDMSVSFNKVPKGEYVKLTVADNGCGIERSILNKIFDPFYTTKTTDKKRGSGLGLSIVNTVVKDHHGYLDIESEVGKGTSIYLYFPITRDAVTCEDLKELKGGNEKILIVDDDSIQRSVTEKLLDKLGYEVTVCSSGEDAVELIQNRPQDLVLLDMVMPPGMDGTETYKKISTIYPHQKAIIASGFSETERVLEAQRLGCGSFVKKPFTIETIAHAIRYELDQNVSAPA